MQHATFTYQFRSIVVIVIITVIIVCIARAGANASELKEDVHPKHKRQRNGLEVTRSLPACWDMQHRRRRSYYRHLRDLSQTKTNSEEQPTMVIFGYVGYYLQELVKILTASKKQPTEIKWLFTRIGANSNRVRLVFGCALAQPPLWNLLVKHGQEANRNFTSDSVLQHDCQRPITYNFAHVLFDILILLLLLSLGIYHEIPLPLYACNEYNQLPVTYQQKHLLVHLI